jgi:hypothetical protein
MCICVYVYIPQYTCAMYISHVQCICIHIHTYVLTHYSCATYVSLVSRYVSRVSRGLPLEEGWQGGREGERERVRERERAREGD